MVIIIVDLGPFSEREIGNGPSVSQALTFKTLTASVKNEHELGFKNAKSKVTTYADI